MGKGSDEAVKRQPRILWLGMGAEVVVGSAQPALLELRQSVILRSVQGQDAVVGDILTVWGRPASGGS